MAYAKMEIIRTKEQLGFIIMQRHKCISRDMLLRKTNEDVPTASRYPIVGQHVTIDDTVEVDIRTAFGIVRVDISWREYQGLPEFEFPTNNEYCTVWGSSN